MSKEFDVPKDWHCHREIEENWIDSGYDSDVFRYDRYVVKAYKRGPKGRFAMVDESKLFLYQEITDRAFELVSNEAIKLSIPNSQLSFDFEVNRFMALRRCSDCGYFEGLSLYIDGKGLNIIPKSFDPHDLNRALMNLSWSLGDKLGVGGINLVPVNVKMVESDKCVVTDICSSISDLTVKKKYI